MNTGNRQQKHEIYKVRKVEIQENEYWYGFCVKYGRRMPVHRDSSCVLDADINRTPNQSMPLFVSTKGRYLWRNTGFGMRVGKGVMEMPEDVELETGYGNLRGAYLAAMAKHFPFSSKGPARELFDKIIYNTWIELTFHQNQSDVLKYAQGLLSHGLPPGVLMIDDGWAESYGNWRFHSGRFPDYRGMLKELHAMGFEVMLWVCPYVTADTEAYREGREKDIFIKTKEGEVFLTKWWNGYSAVLDLSNENAREWFSRQLAELVEAGVDGFKFDGGDSLYYREDNVTAGQVTPDEQSRLWAAFGERYRYNEYRATFRAGGMALLQRLCDKEHSWGAEGIASLIPDSLLQGITGHPYGCPDMIGGGEYLSFQETAEQGLDEMLFVRHAEIACLMPAMQFSADPHRVLGKEAFQAVLRSIGVRERYREYRMECVNHAVRTGEPIIRYMSYEFPEEPVERITDQFMLGSKMLVAPLYRKEEEGRQVYLPRGEWKYRGETLKSSGEVRWLESVPGEPVILERL